MTVDLVRLAQWMDDERLGEGPIESVETLSGGTQNLLVRFRRADQLYVLRRPPVHKRPNSDETMRREARVLAALADTGVPHPRLIRGCDSVDVLGASFYLMEDVVGSNPTVELPPPYRGDPKWRRAFGLALADSIAAVGSIDYVEVGLSDFGTVDGYLERQVPRWSSQLDSYRGYAGYRGPGVEAVNDLTRWLDAHRPETWRPGLIHGDFHLANVLCALDRPAVAAIVDWELSTIGDPLLDLGWLLATWPPPSGPLPGALSVTPWNGFPTASALVARYALHTDRDLTQLPWYFVLACYKLGILLEGTFARACAGQADPEVGERLHRRALSLFDHGRQAMAGDVAWH